MILLNCWACTACLQEDKLIFGKWEFHNDEGFSGGNNYYLQIRKNGSFTYKSDSHNEGAYIENGSWVLKNDSLYLNSDYRMVELNDEKRESKVNTTKGFKIQDNKICWVKSELEFCFEKK